MTHSLCDVQSTTFQQVPYHVLYRLAVKTVCGMVLVLTNKFIFYLVIVITVDL